MATHGGKEMDEVFNQQSKIVNPKGCFEHLFPVKA